MKSLVVVPARGASKGIPGKNIKELNGKPLIEYTLNVASQISSDRHICVSTDSLAIKSRVEEFGLSVPYVRPARFATDYSGMVDVLLDGLEFYEGYNSMEYDVIILLQPTSPFRNAKHVRDAVNMFDFEFDMVASVTESQGNPYYSLFEEDSSGFLVKSKLGNYIRRQDCPRVWKYNGSIYVINSKSLKSSKSMNFKKIVKYEMDFVHSLDLDTMMDWKIAEFFMRQELNV